MAIILDSETRLVVAGLTGSEGRFHGLRNRAYGTNVVAGMTPGKGGQDVEGIPVFDTMTAAVEETGANTSLIFVPARGAVDSIYEAVDAGIGTVICITEHVPAHEAPGARPRGQAGRRLDRRRGGAHAAAPAVRRSAPSTRAKIRTRTRIAPISTNESAAAVG